MYMWNLVFYWRTICYLYWYFGCWTSFISCEDLNYGYGYH